MEDRKKEFEDYRKRIDDIIREGRDINFVDIKIEIETTIDFFLAYYSDAKYQARFTQNQRQDIQNYCYAPFVSAINQILSKTDWQGVSYDNYRSEIQQAFQRLLSEGYITRVEAAKGSDNKALNDKLREFEEKSDKLIVEQKASLEAAQNAASEAFQNLESQRVDIDKKIRQIDARAEKAAKSLAKQVSSENGEVFLKDSEKYSETAKLWLVALIAVITIAAGIITWLFVDISVDPKRFTDNLVFSGLKVSALLILIYLIQLCSRNYGANKHLEITNRQRATVVSFVNTFVNSVDGDEYKDYLLTYAAKTVFDHGETGFISRNYGAGSSSDDGLDTILNNISKFR